MTEIYREIPDPVLNLLKQKFNILAHTTFLEFDQNFDLLRNCFTDCFKAEFDPRDRIIIEHLDTDYYIPNCDLGINFRNLFCVAEEFNIPNFVFLIYTNHVGIQKEIDMLCPEPLDRPTVIESFISKRHFDADTCYNVDVNVEQIQHHAVSVLGASRSHRFALYNKIKNIDAEKIILSVGRY